MDEHDGPVLGENKVGCSGQPLPVQPIAKPQTVRDAAHDQFRAGVPATDAPHDVAALRWRPRVHETVHYEGGGTSTARNPLWIIMSTTVGERASRADRVRPPDVLHSHESEPTLWRSPSSPSL